MFFPHHALGLSEQVDWSSIAGHFSQYGPGCCLPKITRSAKSLRSPPVPFHMLQTQICKVVVPLRFQKPTIKMLSVCWSAGRCHARPGCCLRENIYICVTACIPTETLGLADLLTCHWHYEKWWCSSQGIKVDKAWSQTTHLINAKESSVHQDRELLSSMQ